MIPSNNVKVRKCNCSFNILDSIKFYISMAKLCFIPPGKLLKIASATNPYTRKPEKLPYLELRNGQLKVVMKYQNSFVVKF